MTEIKSLPGIDSRYFCSDFVKERIWKANFSTDIPCYCFIEGSRGEFQWTPAEYLALRSSKLVCIIPMCLLVTHFPLVCADGNTLNILLGN